jgi:folate-binding protein YgfZ
MLPITEELMTIQRERWNPSVEKEYRAIQSSAGVVQRGVSFLEMHGNDAPDFLQRMSTNDVQGLKQNQFCSTVLTTEKAKIIDLVTVVNLGTHLLLMCSEGNSAQVKKWLEKYIIMEDIQVSDVSLKYTMITSLGVNAKSLLSNFFEKVISPDLGSVLAIAGDGDNFIYQDELWAMPTYNMVLTGENTRSYWSKLSVIATQLSPDVVDIFRIEQGVPKYGTEFMEQVNPLEAGLEKYVSFTKGCYIGQEVIARIDTYKKLQKKLSGFIFSNPELYQVGSGKVFYAGNEVGWITSMAWSFKLQKLIALGYLKTSLTERELEYLPEGSDKRYSIRSCSLPFLV